MATALYPGIPFSPQATLTNNIGAADSIIEVSDVSAFPPAPNLATIGTDEEGETILYTAKTETALSGCQRGIEGTARAWTAGNAAASASSAASTAQAAAAEAKETADEALEIVQAADGLPSNTVDVVVDTAKQYAAALAFFKSTITVNIAAGAYVTCTDGTTTLDGTSNGSVVFTVHNAATWQIVGSMNGETTSGTVQITAGGQSKTLNLEFFSATITVNVESGSTVTCTKGTATQTRTSTGSAVFTVKEAGTYTITAEKDGQTAVQYRNIENPWGNVREWRDGIIFSDTNISTYNNPANFSDASAVEEMAPGVAVASLAFVTLAEGGQIDDATAAEHAAQFERWAQAVSYKAGAIRVYEGLLYRCVQDHTSQTGWEPSAAVSLWTKIADPSEEWPAWSQPIGAHDAYGEGDKVSHNGGKWVSSVASNVWEPGVYGWTEYTGEDEEAAPAAVDAGTYTNFVRDGAGYGLARRTKSGTRKTTIITRPPTASK